MERRSSTRLGGEAGRRGGSAGSREREARGPRPAVPVLYRAMVMSDRCR